MFHVERGEGLYTIDTKIGNRMKKCTIYEAKSCIMCTIFTLFYKSILTYQSNSTIVWIWNGFHIGKIDTDRIKGGDVDVGI